MATICFNILNACATQLPCLHQLSDAGIGPDLMHLTPTRDTELIINGHCITQLPNDLIPNTGLLSHGGISPAVLTRGLLRLFHKAGHHIEFRSFNFNVKRPKTGKQSWISQQHFGGLGQDCQAMIQQDLLPCLIHQAQRGCISLVAECGVGGTTFSTLWLRLLTGLQVSPAGSTTDSHKLASKEILLQQLAQEYWAESDGDKRFNLDTLLSKSRYHDHIQQALCLLFKLWPRHFSLPKLCGGMMFVAPLLAYRELAYRDGQVWDHPVSIYTTRWVAQGEGQRILNFLAAQDTLQVHSSHFNQSTLHCLKVFEQGQVVEGCGLGGALVLAEELGWSETDIIAALTLAVTEHLNHVAKSTLGNNPMAA
ncbi:MAG: hypothetical protein ACRCVV_13975 [Shewanella sp.]